MGNEFNATKKEGYQAITNSRLGIHYLRFINFD